LEKQGELQQRLGMLVSQVEAIQDGDLTVHAESSNPDVAVIANLFNVVVEKLREMTARVKNSTTEMTTAIEQSSVNSPLDYTHQSLNAIARMRESIKTVVKSAKKTTKITQLISQAATTSNIAINSTSDHITRLHDSIGDMAQKTKRVGEASQKISQFVSIINAVATQTNLLAINAGIEATRNNSGNHGFAVVVEEIEILANRSATAASEIELLLTSIQRETSELTQIMELEDGELTQGSELIAQTKFNLNQILDVCQEIDALAHSMSSATVSQVKLSQQVRNDLEKVVKISQSANGEYISVSLQNVLDISKKLQASAEAFKVT
jgi:methyl-accepting chemotaxis protein PixJ